VGIASNETNYARKGYDRIMELATRMPEVLFVCIGLKADGPIPLNVLPYQYLPHEEVLGYMAEVKVYLQLSRYEGFCVSLGEAMSYGCYPIVSDTGMMKDIVGAAGYVVPFSTREEVAIDLTIHEIRIALKNNYPYLPSVYQIGRFTPEIRRDRITKIVHDGKV
jgi:glycosyltransferase involved in cell wall biosynthesis